MLGFLTSHLGRHPATVDVSPAQRAADAKRAMLIPLAGAQFLASYDTSSMNVAISNIVADLNTTVTGVQTALSLFTLTMAALMIPGSKLTDIFGRKKCFIAGLWVYGSGALLTALAPGLGVMILGFSFLEGVGSALMIPPIYILITLLYSDIKARTKAFAVVSSMAGLGSAAGPLLGGLITTTITWRASFAGEVVAILVLIYLSRRLEDPPLPAEKPRFDLLGAVLSASGLVFIVLGLLQAGDYGWLRARKPFEINGNVLLDTGDVSPVVVLMGIGLILLGVFYLHIVRSERRGGQPLLSTRLFRSAGTNLGLVTQNSQWFILIGTMFTVSVFLQVSRGYNAIETGLILTPTTAGILIASSRIAKALGRFSQRGVIRLGFAVALVGIVLLVFGGWADASVLWMAPGLFCIGFGAGFMLTASVNLVQSSVPESEQGELSGVSRSVSNLGSSMGTAIAGAVLISALVAGITSLTDESMVLNENQKAQMSAAMQGDVTAVSDEQVMTALEGQPQDVVDEVVRINAESRDRALGLSLLAVAVVGLLGFGAAMLLPPDREGVAET